MVPPNSPNGTRSTTFGYPVTLSHKICSSLASEGHFDIFDKKIRRVTRVKRSMATSHLPRNFSI